MTKDTKEFIGAIHRLVRYWRNVEYEPSDNPDETKWRLDGLAFSILVLLDGCHCEIGNDTVERAINGPDMLHELFSNT